MREPRVIAFAAAQDRPARRRGDDAGDQCEERGAHTRTRTRSANLAGLAGAVRLAEDFGTPLLRAPVTMLLPTAGFILLPIFAIVLGPIALRLAGGSLF